MKILFGVLCPLVVLVTLYGLAYLQVLPAQQWADQNPKMAQVLVMLHLAQPKKQPPAAVTAKRTHATAPTAVPVKAAAPQTALLASQPSPSVATPAAPPSAPAVPPTPTPGDTKLLAIYATMSPDDLANIFAKMPDNAVMDALSQLDEKQAGKVLAAMPSDRAARLSVMMAAPPPQPAPPTQQMRPLTTL